DDGPDGFRPGAEETQGPQGEEGCAQEGGEAQGREEGEEGCQEDREAQDREAQDREAQDREEGRKEDREAQDRQAEDREAQDREEEVSVFPASKTGGPGRPFFCPLPSHASGASRDP